MKFFLLIVVLLLLAAAKLSAQESINSDYTIDGERILLTYQIEGDAETQYQVNVELKRKNNENFSLTPSSLTGDVGVGKFAGGKRTIIWIPNEKEIPLIEGEDFYFEVTSKSLKPSSGGSSWLLWAGGALLVGGGTYALLKLLKKDGDTDGVTVQEIPLPPSRP